MQDAAPPAPPPEVGDGPRIGPSDALDAGTNPESGATDGSAPPVPRACISQADVGGCASAGLLEPKCFDLRPGDPCVSGTDLLWLSGCLQTTVTTRFTIAGTCEEWREEKGNACKVDVSAVQAPPVVASAPHRAACTSKQVADVGMMCFSAVSSFTACSNWVNVAANSDCYSCVFSKGAAPGPIRTLLSGDTIFNIGGCIAATTTEAASRACGQKLDAVAHCANVACAACADDVAFDACFQSAVANECQQKFDPTLCEASLPPAARECLAGANAVIAKFCQ